MDPVQTPSWRPRRRHPPKPPPPQQQQQQQQQHLLQRGPQSEGNRAERGASQEQHLQPPSKQPRAAIKSFDQLRAENASTSTRAAASPTAGNAGPDAPAAAGGGPTVLLRRPHQQPPAPEKRVQTPPKQNHPPPREGVPDGAAQRRVLQAQDQVHRQQRRQKHSDLKQQPDRQEQREARQQWQQQDDARRQAGRQPAKLRPEAQPADGSPASVRETPLAEPSEDMQARNVRHTPPAASTDASSGVTPIQDGKEKESVGSKDADNEKRKKSKAKKKQSLEEEGGVAQAAKDSSSSKKSKKKKKKKKPKSSQEPKTKVVIRRLPAYLPEEAFWESVKPWVNNEDIDWKCFIPGKLPTSRVKMAAFGRAYIHFKSLEAVLAFHRSYDGHVFEDSSGNASRAVVEFAPFQGIPKEKKKRNQRQGTIGEDTDFLAFLEHLKADPASALSTVDENENPAPDQKTSIDGKLSTPLLDELREKKAIAQAASRYRGPTSNPPRVLGMNNGVGLRRTPPGHGNQRDAGSTPGSPKVVTATQFPNQKYGSTGGGGQSGAGQQQGSRPPSAQGLVPSSAAAGDTGSPKRWSKKSKR